MAKISAGILIYREKENKLEILLVHPGGPFWKNKDLGSWSIPKGENGHSEDLLHTAIRECEEEIGIRLQGEFIELGSITQKGGKIVHAWAIEKNLDTRELKSKMIEIRWPPVMGKTMEIPEVDKIEYFGLSEALKKMNPAQTEFIERLQTKIK